MKKLLYAVLMAYLCYFSIGSLIDYSIELDNVTSDKAAINIVKPHEASNEDFISLLESISRELGCDILLKTTTFSEGSYINSYYMTQNDRKSVKSISNEKYSQLSDAGYLKYETLFGGVCYYKFNNIKEMSLESGRYYVNENKLDEFVSKLTEKDISVSIMNEVSMADQFINIRTQVYPLCIIAFTMIFFVLSQRKEVIIKRLNGYSTLNIMLVNFLKFLRSLLIILVSVCFVATLIHTLLFPDVFKEILVFLAGRIVFISSIVACGFVVINLLTLLPSSQLDIKGRVQNKQLFATAFVFKSVVCLMVVAHLSTAFVGLTYIYNINKTYNFILDKVGHYVGVPFNLSLAPHIDPTNMDDIKEIDSKALDFYKLTVDRFKGVIIESRNYDNYGRESLAEKHGQNDIMINENYLDLNPIYDKNGHQISRDMLDPQIDALNLLVPESLESTVNNIKQQHIRWYQELWGLKDESINIIIYDDVNSSIYAYDSYVINAENGKIKSPIIEVFNEKYAGNQITNFFGSSYFLNVDSSNPREKLLPYLIESKLDQLVLYTPTVKEDFAEKIKILRDELIKCGINILINLTGLVALAVYVTKLYCTNNRKKIAVRRMNGYGFIETFKMYLGIQTLAFGILIILQIALQELLGINITVFLAVAAMDIILFVGVAKAHEKNQITETIKEGAN